MVLQATDQLVSPAVRSACEPAICGCATRTSGHRGPRVARLAVLPVALDPVHGAVAVSQPGDPSRSDPGGYRRKLFGLAAGTGDESVFGRHGGLCSRASTIARGPLGAAHTAHRPGGGPEIAARLAMDGPRGQGIRRLDPFDARYTRESSRLPATQQPSAGGRVPLGPHRRVVLVVGRNGPPSGDPSLEGKIPKRTGHAPRHVRSVRSGRRVADRLLPLLLHGNSCFTASGCRFRGSDSRSSEGRLSPRKTAWAPGPCGRVDQAAASRLDVAR